LPKKNTIKQGAFIFFVHGVLFEGSQKEVNRKKRKTNCHIQGVTKTLSSNAKKQNEENEIAEKLLHAVAESFLRAGKKKYLYLYLIMKKKK
jgi:hypothetical protein